MIIDAHCHAGRGDGLTGPWDTRARLGDYLRRAAIAGIGRGIKVHRHDARISREICETAQAHRLPILYDVMGDTAQIELLAAEYPDVRFIIPHLGWNSTGGAASRPRPGDPSAPPRVYRAMITSPVPGRPLCGRLPAARRI